MLGEQSWVYLSIFFQSITSKQWEIDTLLSTELDEDEDGEHNAIIIFQ